MRRVKAHKEAIGHTSKAIKNIELVPGGEGYFKKLLEIISNAQSEIHIQTYIFENDATGLEVAHALIEAANRNVKVYVLLDGYGSAQLPGNFLDDLRTNGIQIRFFSPWHSKNSFYIGRRLHHKVVVVDGEYVIIGGINIGNKYRGSATELPWLDYAVLMESLSIGEPLQQLCGNIYFKRSRLKRRKIQSSLNKVNEASVKILRNDWIKQRNEISMAYINAFRKANKEIIIVASYFLPGGRLLNELKNAAKRNVKVKIILSGVSDLPIVMQATRYLYSSLLKHGIELFEWKKSVLHGKLALVDSEWVTIGSYNMNLLSSYGSIEMNVEIKSPEFSKKIYIHLNDVLKKCEHISINSLKIRNGFFVRLKNWLAFRLVRMALIIATYIPYKRIFKL